MKKKVPPKKKLPFHSRVSGLAGQRRPDRKAPPQRELRRVFSKADADLLNPFEPTAPAGGKESQHFTDDKPIPRPPGPQPKGLKKGGGVLSAKQRQSLPKSSFALPGKGEGPKGAGAGSYPIPDPSHARNALARVSQHGSPAEKARVRAKVHAKYPNIGKRQEGGSIGADLQAARDRGTVEARRIMRGAPLRSESTERARALSRADQDLTNRARGGRGMPREESERILQTFKETGPYKRGGTVKT